MFIGESTIAFIKHCENQGNSYHKIFAFGPDPLNFSYAADTLSKLRDITLINAAVGNKNGVTKFEMHMTRSQSLKMGRKKCVL